MLPIPRRYAHFVYGAIQSCLTSALASAVASLPLVMEGDFLRHWLWAWMVSWMLMLPVVLLAAPWIRRFAVALTRDGD